MDLRRWKRNTLGKFIFILSLLSFSFLGFLIISNGILPGKYRWPLLAVLLIILMFLGYYSFKPRVSAGRRAIIGLISLIFFVVTAYGGSVLHSGMRALDKMTLEDRDVIAFSMVVLKGSEVDYWDQLVDQEIHWAYGQDKNNLDSYYGAIQAETGENLNFVETTSYLEGAKDLLEGEAQVLLLNESYRELIDEHMDFSQRTKIINPNTISLSKVGVEVEKIKKDAKKEESFNLYISGIDTYGKLSTVSRSDVNLIVTVNPRANKIIITTIPRDSYLPLAGAGMGGYDKLTHAGIYGISSSVQTLENFLDIEVNYYARVNFSSLISIVDVLGGISIYNDQAFGSGNNVYSQGNIYLDGERALRFSRERYSLERGDFDRGMNQTKVLAAMIEKALSPSILLNYNELLNVAMEAADTNIPKSKIVELANNQLDKGGKWEISSQEIKGQGQIGLPSHAMPGWNLYMFVPSEDSLDQVKSGIEAVYTAE